MTHGPNYDIHEVPKPEEAPKKFDPKNYDITIVKPGASIEEVERGIGNVSNSK